MRHSTDVDISRVKKDLETLRNDVAKITNAVLTEKQNNAKTFTEGILQGLLSEGHSIVDSAKTTKDNAVKAVTDTSQKAVERVEGKIHQRPFLSLAMSFLSGLVLAEIIERRW